MKQINTGDIVGYFTHAHSTSSNPAYVEATYGLTHHDKSKPLKAEITAVNEDGTVDLLVTDELRFQQPRAGIALLDEGENRPEGGGHAVVVPPDFFPEEDFGQPDA